MCIFRNVNTMVYQLVESLQPLMLQEGNELCGILIFSRQLAASESSPRSWVPCA